MGVVHIRLDFRLGERAVIDAELVDDAVEVIALPPVLRPMFAFTEDSELGVRNGPATTTVVRLPVHVNIQRAGARVIDPRDVIPRTPRPGRPRCIVAYTGRTGHGHSERVRPRVGAGLELPAGGARRTGDDLPVVRRIRGCVDPGFDGHASSQVERGGVAEVDIAGRPIEDQRLPVAAVSGPSGAGIVPVR